MARSRKFLIVFRCVLPAIICGLTIHSQEPQQPFVMKVGANEVALTFRAEDEAGRAVTDLKLSDLKLLDNGHAPSQITLFSHHEQLPVHLAIVVDISPSMADAVQPREVAKRVAQTAIHDARDQSLVMFFDFDSLLEQDWTNDPKLLEAAAAKAAAEGRSRLGGTAAWDSLYKICRDRIPVQTPGSEEFSSAILLFTDGIDNRSHALPEDVMEECQSRQTAIYPFLSSDKSHFDSGQKVLRTLAEMTGGRVFYDQNSANLTASILRIDTDLRDRYTLVYRPAGFKRDGHFHAMKLGSTRAVTFLARSGYYATRDSP